MKWLDVAKGALPLVALLYPPAAPLIPFILAGAHEAEQLPGASGEQKRDHVINIVVTAAQGAASQGVPVNPQTAAATTLAVFNVVDGVKQTVKDVTSAHEGAGNAAGAGNAPNAAAPPADALAGTNLGGDLT